MKRSYMIMVLMIGLAFAFFACSEDDDDNSKSMDAEICSDFNGAADAVTAASKRIEATPIETDKNYDVTFREFYVDHIQGYGGFIKYENEKTNSYYLYLGDDFPLEIVSENPDYDFLDTTSQEFLFKEYNKVENIKDCPETKARYEVTLGSDTVYYIRFYSMDSLEKAKIRLHEPK